MILSALGLRRASLAPWSRLLSPPNLVQSFTGILRRAVAGERVGRVVWISAGGVGDSAPSLTASMRLLTSAGNLGVAYADLEEAEREMPAEDDRWLAVRPVTLVGGSITGRAGHVSRYGLFSTVRRADVASWMLDLVEEGRTVEGRVVLLGTCR